MDEVSTKYVLLAVGIFVILIILSSMLFAYSEVKKIYRGVENTDISIKTELDSANDIIAQYNNTTKNAVSLVNTIKKYQGNNKIKVTYEFQDKILSDISTIETNEKDVHANEEQRVVPTEGEYLNRLLDGTLDMYLNSLYYDNTELKVYSQYVSNMVATENLIITASSTYKCTYSSLFNVTVSTDEQGITTINYTKI